MYIYEDTQWPNFKYDLQRLLPLLEKCHKKQGELISQISFLGLSNKEQIILSTATSDIVKSSEIEGISLNKEKVRSSVANRLGLHLETTVNYGRDIDSIVEMMLDATTNYEKELTKERLFAWHACLFPTGYSGMYKIDVACYRKSQMQVVSGRLGMEKIYYEAPSEDIVPEEMDKFLSWFNNAQGDFFLNAAIAHLWFITIHPFDDGNGRIARALMDMMLSKSDKSKVRFYSMSSEIQKERKAYYEILEKTQHSDIDITDWIEWFLECLFKAMEESEKQINTVLYKYRYLEKIAKIPLNQRQSIILNKLIDGSFYGVLNSSKWAKMTKCSTDTALRDITDLIQKGILKKVDSSGGRSTNYILVE